MFVSEIMIIYLDFIFHLFAPIGDYNNSIKRQIWCTNTVCLLGEKKTQPHTLSRTPCSLFVCQAGVNKPRMNLFTDSVATTLNVLSVITVRCDYLLVFPHAGLKSRGLAFEGSSSLVFTKAWRYAAVSLSVRSLDLSVAEVGVSWKQWRLKGNHKVKCTSKQWAQRWRGS